MNKYFIYDQKEFKIYQTEQKQLGVARRLAIEGEIVYCGIITHVTEQNDIVEI